MSHREVTPNFAASWYAGAAKLCRSFVARQRTLFRLLPKLAPWRW